MEEQIAQLEAQRDLLMSKIDPASKAEYKRLFYEIQRLKNAMRSAPPGAPKPTTPPTEPSAPIKTPSAPIKSPAKPSAPIQTSAAVDRAVGVAALVAERVASTQLTRLMLMAKYISEYCRTPGALDPACEALRKAMLLKNQEVDAIAELMDAIYREPQTDIQLTATAQSVVDEMVRLSRDFERADDALVQQVMRLREANLEENKLDASRKIWARQRLSLGITWARLMETAERENYFADIVYPSENEPLFPVGREDELGLNLDNFFADRKEKTFVNELNAEALRVVSKALKVLTPRVRLLEWFMRRQVVAAPLAAAQVILMSTTHLAHASLSWEISKATLGVVMGASLVDLMRPAIAEGVQVIQSSNTIGNFLLASVIRSHDLLEFTDSPQAMAVILVMATIWQVVWEEERRENPDEPPSRFRELVRQKCLEISPVIAQFLSDGITLASYALLKPLWKKVWQAVVYMVRCIPVILGHYARRWTVAQLRYRLYDDFAIPFAGAAAVTYSSANDAVKYLLNNRYTPKMISNLWDASWGVREFVDLPATNASNQLVNELSRAMVSEYSDWSMLMQQQTAAFTPKELRENFNQASPAFLPAYEERVRLIRDAPTLVNLTTVGDELQLRFGGAVTQAYFANLTACERQEFWDTTTQVMTARGKKAGVSPAESTILNMASGRGVLSSIGRGVQAGAPQLAGTFARGFWEPLGPPAFYAGQVAVNRAAQINLSPVVVLGHSTLSIVLGIAHYGLFATSAPIPFLMWLTTAANVASIFTLHFGVDEYLFGTSLASIFNTTLGVDVGTETGITPFFLSKSRRNEK